MNSSSDLIESLRTTSLEARKAVDILESEYAANLDEIKRLLSRNKQIAKELAGLEYDIEESDIWAEMLSGLES